MSACNKSTEKKSQHMLINLTEFIDLRYLSA